MQKENPVIKNYILSSSVYILKEKSSSEQNVNKVQESRKKDSKKVKNKL